MADNLPQRPDGDPAAIADAGGNGAVSPVDPEVQYFDPFEEDEVGFDWRRHLAALRRYKWLALTITVLGTAGGVGVARWIPAEYRAQTTLWIETSGRGDAARGPITTGQLFASQSWINLLKSYTVLDSVVIALDLYIQADSAAADIFSDFQLENRFAPGDYELSIDSSGSRFTLSMADGGVVQRGFVGDSIGRKLGLAWVPKRAKLPAGHTVAFTVAVPRDISRQLAERLDPRMDPNGNFLEVRLRGARPERITRILNAMAERFVEVAANLKGAKLEELTRILREQLRYAQQRLDRAEIALESFRVNTITLPSERATPIAPGVNITRDPVLSNFFRMKLERDELVQARDAIERALAQARDSIIPVAALEAIPAVQSAPLLNQALTELVNKRAELRALRYRYTDRHPPVRELIEEIETIEKQTIPNLATQLVGELAARERELSSRIESAGVELESIPIRAIEEARLARAVTTAENLYLNLRQRYENARLASASSIPDVRVLDEAVVPRQPINNTDPRIILMALLGSLGTALISTILLDRIDPRVRYPDQITHGLGLAILGTVPRVRHGNSRSASDSALQVVEAFRALRLSVIHAHGTAGPLVVNISSPTPGDGKSIVASNLALAFADLGERTLLIDGDTRRGSAHRLLERDRKPGLTDFLAGETSAEHVVQRTDYDSLDLIASGQRRARGPELLSSPEMRQFVLDCRKEYGVIILDSPPLAAGVDAFLLGTLAGNMVLVIRNGSTDRMVAETKLDMLDRMPVRVLGAVLNDVPGTGVYRYYSYPPEYAPRDESGDRPAAAIPGTAM